MRRTVFLLVLALMHGFVFAEAFRPVEPEIVLEVSLAPKLANDDVPATTPPITIDEDAYLFGIAYQWDSNVPDLFGVSKSTQEYYELFAMKHVFDGEDFVESVSEIGVIYGRKYFLLSDVQRGLAYGWYGGFSLWDSEGRDYDGNTAFAPYSESGLSAIIAAELRYDYRIRIGEGIDLLAYPAFTLGFDKDFNELTVIPRLMVGVVF